MPLLLEVTDHVREVRPLIKFVRDRWTIAVRVWILEIRIEWSRARARCTVDYGFMGINIDLPEVSISLTDPRKMPDG